MAWRDALRELTEELADVRAQRQERAAAEDAELAKARDELTGLAQNLDVAALLTEINATLLEGKGQIEAILSWEAGGDDDQDDDDLELFGPETYADPDEEEDVASSVLTWDEDGDREIAVEVIMSDDGISLQVNGVEVRPEREALEAALVEAFRDELEL